MDTSRDETPTFLGASAGPAIPFYDPRFQPIAELGRGGMGMVYRCRDMQMEREVAVKIRRDSLTSEGARTRFSSEARLQGRLQHPAIVPVYELHETVDGREFFVMREIDGVTLRAVVNRQRSGFGRHALLAAFSRVCMAIDYCHRQGVLHRDLKPDNVMLGNYGEVYVLDWGLAVDEHALQLAAGTPAYAAPEQLRGDATARSDVYSLGKMLLEILATHDDAPPELTALGQQASDDDPDARAESPRVLAEAVDRFLDGERDLELRRRLADSAALDARAAAAEPTADARRSALQLAGRALALDPDHAYARTVLHELLTAPPVDPPPEVVDGTRNQHAGAIRSGMFATTCGFLGILALMPLELAMGVRDVPWFVVRTALVIAALVSCIGTGRWWRETIRAMTVTFVLTAVVAVTSSLVLGPFVTIPSLAVVLASVLALLGGSRYLVLTSLTAIAMLLAPLLLELAGVFPRSFELRGDTMILHARLLDLPPAATIAYLALKEIIIIVVVGAMFGRCRDILTNVEQRIKIHTWQLEQLVPSQRPS